MAEKTETEAPRGPGCVLCETVRPFLEHMWSDATNNHFRNSRLEFLKGIRSVLDARIAHLSREHQKGTHVVVE